MAIVCGTSKCRKGFRKARQAASFPGDDIVLNDAIGIIFTTEYGAFQTAHEFLLTGGWEPGGKYSDPSTILNIQRNIEYFREILT